ncbi:MAG: sugar-binding domain-containing protein [Rhodothermales bacterium]
MLRLTSLTAAVFAVTFITCVPVRALQTDVVPLPEHPRPDFERAEWVNLNGTWDFRFEDPANDRAATVLDAPFAQQILVPFSWGAPLSGVEDEADVGWYRRSITIPDDWEGRRVFLVIGAADWTTTVWVDGVELGSHRGGYTPFEFELTSYVEAGAEHQLVLRVDDTPHDFKLEGKQGYGPARGIWQTPYLEARGTSAIDLIHFTPDLSDQRVGVSIHLLEAAPEDLSLQLAIRGRDGAFEVERTVPAGTGSLEFNVPVADPVLWTLEDPHLYEVTATVSGNGAPDRVETYFGMREIGVVDLPGTEYPYIALNGEPVYLETALDQAYHPEGYYTFPSDAFMRDEILRSRRIGLNGMRIHVKIGIPRKLYWADRLGMLIMADVPNSWGEPTEEMRGEVEYALRGMIERDYNHPSIFSWVPFNETWGLRTGIDGDDVYTDDAKDWVVSVVELAREMDSTRLVEDNSVCCGVGHTVTDINSWHIYTTGYNMPEHLDMVSDNTYPGSTWNYEDGYQHGDQPLFNSEFGNVWGYEGSTGDVDWSWDYHIFMNEFRRHPKISGWLYTEHHDVVNEWNGYWKYDRSEKFTGLDAFVDGMSLRDLHAPLYVAVGDRGDLARDVVPGEVVDVPLWVSFMTGSDAYGDELRLEIDLHTIDRLGRRRPYASAVLPVSYRPWRSEALSTIRLTMPEQPGLAVVTTKLTDGLNAVLHRNFTTYVVTGDDPEIVETLDGRRARLVRVAAADYADADWSAKEWNVLDGLKVNGAGSGYFEYRLPWPDDVAPGDVERSSFLFEASAKQLYGKDVEGDDEMDGDYMRGGGAHDPSLNPNAYPMTDEYRFPSAVTVRVGETVAGVYDLEDDPADHRGILSWHAQPEDNRLREAGSYGWLVDVPIPREELARAARAGELVVRLEVDEALPHGLAIYGSQFGRYPLDPTWSLILHDIE